jgi:hypothetical protein
MGPMSAESYPQTVVLGTSVYFSRVVTGPQSQLTVMVLVGLKIVGQLKIMESFGLKPVSHLTVIYG